MLKITNVCNFGFVICNLFGTWCFGFGISIFYIIAYKSVYKLYISFAVCTIFSIALSSGIVSVAPAAAL